MNVTSNIDSKSLLKKHFGFDEFKDGQQPIIDRLINGRSCLAVFPTGGGKSLCYQLPALTFEGLTVVVSPLIALMKDQIDQLSSRGIVAVRLDSSLSLEEYQTALSAIRSGQAKILFVAPERFFNERFRGSLMGTSISLFAVDEAHCISQWGHNFRPDYLKLAMIAKELKVERILALTATATPAVQQDIVSAFDIEDEDAICTDFFRPNLHLRTQIVSQPQRIELLTRRLKDNAPGATIIYVTLQKTAESLASTLKDAGLDAQAYHAGLNSEKRTEIQEWFMNQPNRIVVATIAFGMGIDKSDIRYVFHYNVPKSIENYAQEIGRAGRDGKVSSCEMFVVPEDRVTLENFVYGDTPSENGIKSFMQLIVDQEDEFFVSQYKLGAACDIKSIVVKTILTYLELDGHLESTAPRYESYDFKPLVPSAELLSNFDGEKQQFAKRLLACSRKKRSWFSIDVMAAAEKLGCDRTRVIKALDFFDEKGWLELKVSGLVHGYRKRKSFPDVDLISQEYFERLSVREQDEISRIDDVFELARANQCQADSLSTHFGQPLEQPCGNCTHCTNDGSLTIDPPAAQQLDDAQIESVKVLVAAHPQVLNSTRSIARLLCGITSPAMTRTKLSRDPIFGTCAAMPFAHVVEQAKKILPDPE